MNSRLLSSAILLVGFLASSLYAQAPSGVNSFRDVNRYVQPRSVKIYGAGGMRQLEAYQSGILVSAEGHIATVASVVLDQDVATVVLNNGDRYNGEVVGVDPLMDIAVLKIEGEEAEFPYFELNYTPEPFEGMQVWAFSNLYNIATGNEPVSALHGVVATIAPLEARRGAFSTRYRGDVYIVDAETNNPGAPGGVSVDLQGRPLGMIGKEVRSEITGTWLNYVLPLPKVAESVERILNGSLGTAVAQADAELPEQPATFHSLGFRLVPNVVPRTPPYVDQVQSNSPAAAAGLRPDDLVISLGGFRTGSYAEVEEALRRMPIDSPLELTLLRGNSLLDVKLTPQAGGAP